MAGECQVCGEPKDPHTSRTLCALHLRLHSIETYCRRHGHEWPGEEQFLADLDAMNMACSCGTYMLWRGFGRNAGQVVSCNYETGKPRCSACSRKYTGSAAHRHTVGEEERDRKNVEWFYGLSREEKDAFLKRVPGLPPPPRVSGSPRMALLHLLKSKPVD